MSKPTPATADRRAVDRASPTVTALENADLPRVAEIHGDAFPRSALTALGPEAVRRYYEWQLAGPHEAVALGAFDDDELVGFCFAGVYRGAMSGFLARNRAYLATRLLLRPSALADPAFRARATRALGILGRARTANESDSAPPRAVRSFGVLAIATSPRRQGRGVGVALMEAAESVAREREFGRMHLTVDVGNAGAIRFYERLGWTRTEAPDVWKGAMTKSLV